MPLFLSHVAVKIRGLCSVYIVYGAKGEGLQDHEADIQHFAQEAYPSMDP